MRPERDPISKPAETTFDGTTIELPLPLGDIDLFRHGASEDILSFLGLNPDIEVSIRTLAETIGHSEKATRTAVDVLDEAGLLNTKYSENKRLVSIARDRLHRPDDPILSIPQTHYHLPTRLVLNRIHQDLDGVLGVVLFGSVARGEATPQSDIDLWVLVEDDRQQQLHQANKIVNQLDGIQVPPRVAVQGEQIPQITEAILNTWEREILEDDEEYASVPRHSFEILVETPQTVMHKRDEISHEIFQEGILLYGTETLDRIRDEVLG